MLRLRPQRILRDNGILLEEIEYRLGNLNGVFLIPDSNLLKDLGRNRLDGLFLFRFRLRILLRLGCDNLGRFSLADRLPLEVPFRMKCLPGIEDSGRGKGASRPEQGGLVPGVAFQDGVPGNLVVAVTPELNAVAVLLESAFVTVPVEGIHLLQDADAVLADLIDVLLVDGFSLNPLAVFRYLNSGHFGPFVDLVGVIDVPVHIDPIGVDMEMGGVGVVVERHHILTVLDMGGL